jgi:hypothetical protein
MAGEREGQVCRGGTMSRRAGIGSMYFKKRPVSFEDCLVLSQVITETLIPVDIPRTDINTGME